MSKIGVKASLVKIVIAGALRLFDDEEETRLIGEYDMGKRVTLHFRSSPA